MADEPKKENRADWGSGSVRERPEGSGRWELRYPLGKDAAGKRKIGQRTIQAKSENAARRELRRIMAEVDQGQHVDYSKETVAQFIERWLADWAESRVRLRTFERYTELLRLHVSRHIGAMLLQKLTASDLDALYTMLAKTGRDDGLGLAPRTIVHVHRALSLALRQAVLWKNLQANPASSVRPPRVPHAEVEILAPAELALVMEKLKDNPVYPIMVVALGTGARRGEILALRWCDLDLEGGQVRIHRAVEQTKRQVIIDEPKTKNSRRTVSMPAFVVAELKSHRRRQQERRLALGLGKPHEDALVFGHITGEVLRPDTLTKQWAKAMKGLGLKFKLHALRHTCASALIASGLDVLSVSRRLGHANATMTLQTYSHLFRDNDDRAVRALDAAFSSVPGTAREPSANS